METQLIRLRLVFEDCSALTETQQCDGMNQSWLLAEPNQNRKISDVCDQLLHIFNLRDSCPNGILLYMDGFVLPPYESTRILKDMEVLCVKRKGMALTEAIEVVDGGNLVDHVEVNRKASLNNGIELLENEEFDKEEKLEPIETVSKKRKASTKIQSSKSEHLQDNVEGVKQASTAPNEAKKGPSRSARRKKAKKQWRRKLAKISQNDEDAKKIGFMFLNA